MNLLHIIVSAGETNCQYNEHCLPVKDRRNITICTYFDRKDSTPEEITLFNGDNSLIGFWRALNAALKFQKYDAIHVHSPITGFLFLLGAILGGGYQKIKPITVYTVHNSYPNFPLKHRILMIPIFLGFQELIFCSHACLESFPHWWKRLGGHKINVVQNAANLNRIDRAISDVERTNSRDQFEVISVGRLIPIKNFSTLLKAFQKANDLHSQLTLIGDGKLRESLMQESDQLNLHDRVSIIGLVPRDAVFQYSARADLFVSTSRGEGLPVAVLEVMASGCPVILSDIPPHREIARKVDFIPLLDPNDIDGFAREIKRFREMSREQRLDIGRQCRKIVEEQFSLDSMHRGYTKIYDRISEKQLTYVMR
ncbi:MAG TPA: glycosyltransferase family 4 protein [Oscillatoriales cyanobacterium M59_W2019_021]|nr:glycosyltransferase family 4 protein [Oscillatoriales cyanobacterium M4454_W2019_049]HIK51929.1 glycosyltransferase family 4 protein [Oscillatoriales cyanobacterium M59_W2019_021]